MPLFVAALLGGLAQAAASITGRVLLALGIGFVAYQGIDLALSALMTTAQSSIAAAPVEVGQVLGLTKIDVAIKMIFSSITARLIINGLTSGLVKRMVHT